MIKNILNNVCNVIFLYDHRLFDKHNTTKFKICLYFFENL